MFYFCCTCAPDSKKPLKEEKRKTNTQTNRQGLRKDTERCEISQKNTQLYKFCVINTRVAAHNDGRLNFIITITKAMIVATSGITPIIELNWQQE